MQTIDQMGRRGILCPTMGQRVLVAGTGTWEAQGVNPLCSTPCAH
jgi:hypothetical protein